MPIEGVDYSLARPDPACLFAAGKRFACRYVSNPGGINKDMSPDETRALTAAGVAICTNWEAWETRTLGGRLAGQIDAAEGLRLAQLSGMPDNRPIYFSVDFDASAAQLAGPIADYFRGCIDILSLSRVGAYGGIRTIKFLFDNGLITWGWQTYAWSSGQWDARAHVQQYKNATTVCGASVDLDRAMVDDYGQWLAFQLVEEDLAITQEAFDAAIAGINANVDALETKLAARIDDAIKVTREGRVEAREQTKRLLDDLRAKPTKANFDALGKALENIF